jgi:hypothetical protein
LIAIFDYSEDKVVLIGDKTYRISFEEFNRIENKLRAIGLLVLNGRDSHIATSVVKQPSLLSGNERLVSEQQSGQKEYIGSASGKCVIVNGLEPKIQFMGLDDIKSIGSISSTYGSIPEAISILIKNGQLVLLNDAEKAERLEKMKQKMAVKGKSIKQASSKSVRLSENAMEDSGYEDSSDVDVEDRVMRNAVKIDL